MADAQPEEAGESERLDAGIEAFQRAAEHFRAYVDAEGHLQCHPVGGDRGRGGRCKHAAEPPLCGSFGRFL
ncbi:hypothetical protein NB717_001123 [Xanthomonas sacchari]|nr:hypothetical protein [Xanthomonas sacchari]